MTTPSAPSAGEVARPAAPIPPVSSTVPGVVLNGSPATTASTTEPPFVSLYNGQDLTGWEVHDGKIESWRAEGEQLSCIAPGGGWLRTKQRYSDFVLRVEYRLSAGANTGIAFRFPPEGNPSSNGFEVQLIDDSAAKYQGISPVQHTGSLYYLAAPQATGASKVAGDWNLCQVTGRGPRVEIRINGLVVNSVALDDPALNPAGNATRRLADQRPPLGHIGLQSYQTRVDFRKIEIQDLTAATSGGVRFVEITPGAGDPVPPESVVTVHFRGQFTDGRVFIRSRDRGGPVTVALKDVIPGWKEGLVGMKVGGRRKLIVPPELAYGDGGFATLIPPRATLVYDVELVSFQPPAPTATTVPVSALPVR